ncbi:hypothetical protein V3C99_012278 [Haemonchus contortus]
MHVGRMVHPSCSSHRLLPAIVLIAILVLIISPFRKSQSHENPEMERRHPSDLTTIIVVTPTHKRPERLADMIRLSQTLSHVPRLHWIVVEDGETTVPAVSRILQRSGVPHVYLATTSSAGMPRRGWTHRNVALQYVRENYDRNRSAVLYFADDDNTYDIRLFNNYIRKVTRIGVWAVGLVGGAWVEAPHVSSGGKVIAWDVMFAPGRPFATDMAGFAINIRELFRARNASFNLSCAKTYKQGPESCFLSQFGFKKEDLEPFGYNDYPKEILVWHTRTSRSKTKGPKRGYAIETNN